MTYGAGFTAAAVAAAVGVSALVVFVVGSLTPHRAPLAVGYLLRLGVGVGIFTSAGLYAPDAMNYDADAANRASGAALSATLGKEGYTQILSLIYTAVGHIPLVGILLNVTVGALLIPLLAATTTRAGGPGRVAAWLVALFPPLVFWGSLLLREALVWFALGVVAWATVGIAGRMRRPGLGWLTVALLGLFWVRGTAALLAVVGLAVTVVLVRRGVGQSVMLLAALGAVWVSPIGARATAILDAYQLDDINRSRNALTTMADSGFQTAAYDGTLGTLLSLPTMLPRTLLGPYPWEWSALNPLFAAEALAWLGLLFLAWRGRRQLVAGVAGGLLAQAGVVLFSLAVTSGNYGTMLRLRVLAVVFLIPLAAAGWQVGVERRAARRRPAVTSQPTRYSQTRTPSRTASSQVRRRSSAAGTPTQPGR